MGNVSSNSNDKTVREKVLKKAAMLATVASITGACAMGAQKPKESKALIGAIVGIITTVVGVGSSIASTVQSSKAEKEAQRLAKLQAQEEERARKEQEEWMRQEAERMRKEAEEQKIRETLERAENNVRVSQQLSAQEQSASKEIDISIANNDELMAKSASRVSIHTTGVNRVTAPKDINVGGFGVSEENVEENTESQVQEDSQETEETSRGSLISSTETESDTTGSNIVRFSLSDLSVDEGFNSSDISDVIQEEFMVHGVGLVGGYNSDNINSEDYVEIDESMLMSIEEAEEHGLVKEGFLTAEDLIILDFGIRNGAINQEIIDAMYESGDISDEYYEGAVELMNEIYGEFTQE